MSSDNKAFVHKNGNLITAKGRLLWNSLFQVRKAKGGKDGKFECNLLFPKTADNKALLEGAREAGTEKFAKAFKDSAGKWPSAVKTPFKKTADNDKLVAALEAAEMDPADWPLFIAARSKDKPGVVGPNGKSDGVDAEQVYQGRWARMSVQAYGYDTDGNKGVTFGLVNVQLLDNADELSVGGGKVSAESEFEPAEGAGDDSSSSDDMFA
jgi:hypothetical protein